MPTRILIIDDDPVLSRVMADALAEYNVTLAQTAEVGLELYEKEPFDLVLCDLVLPGMSGTEFIERIREKYPQARLIVASAQGSGENLLATLRQNVVAFLVKPFDTEDLRCAVSNLLAADQSNEVVSATPSWVELRVPASFQIAASLESFFNNLQVGIDETTQRNVS